MADLTPIVHYAALLDVIEGIWPFLLASTLLAATMAWLMPKRFQAHLSLMVALAAASGADKAHSFDVGQRGARAARPQ